ncbi:MAG: hypothetical protein KGL39_00140 [Patescibacteria group bacterium]|nr:hypothetical protein [Patescibacteria group bacterium]
MTKLLSKAEQSAKHHRNREAFYRDEYLKAETELRTNGIVMVENAHIIASGSVTGYGFAGRSVSPHVNEKMVQAVDDAKSKIQEHQRLAGEYERYVKAFRVALSLDENKMIELDSEDVAFFQL